MNRWAAIGWGRLIGTALMLASVGPASAAPDWVQSLGRASAYPPATHVTGFGMSPGGRELSLADKRAQARNAAAAGLAQSLRVSVSAEDSVHRFSRMVGQDEELVDEFRSRTVLKTGLSLDGLRFEEHVGRESGPVYALAVLERAVALERYRGQFDELLKRLDVLQKQGHAHLSAGRAPEARRTYLACNRLVDAIEENLLLRELLGDRSGLSESAVARLLSVRADSRKLLDRVADSLEDAAAIVAEKLALQGNPTGRVQVNAFMLDDTYQYSQFSGRFKVLLEDALSGHTDLRPLRGALTFQPHSAGIERGTIAEGAEFVASGSYCIKEDSLVLYVRLWSAADGVVVAMASARVRRNAADGLQLQPANYLDALRDRRVFNNRDLVPGALTLEVWTHRGAEGLALEEGETIRLYARVNRPCYLRFIYHLANGARVVPDTLYLNYPIGEDKVNRVIELPGEFEACAPFGSETMQFFASTAAFPTLNQVRRSFDGETYDVLADSLADSNVRHRGLRRRQEKVEVAEVRLPITTLPRSSPLKP